jgi:hypothetical protein
MGWLFIHGSTRADIIRLCTQVEDTPETHWTTLAHCTKGNVLWTVFEVLRKREQQTDRFISCYLMAGSRQGWGYKDFRESSGPGHYSCPLSYLDRVPETNAEWRQLVREHHARLSRTVAIGDTWSLPYCSIPQITITSVRPLRGCYEGTPYRVKRKQLGERLSQATTAPQRKSHRRTSNAVSPDFTNR